MQVAVLLPKNKKRMKTKAGYPLNKDSYFCEFTKSMKSVRGML